jgi:hypothetical protein
MKKRSPTKKWDSKTEITNGITRQWSELQLREVNRRISAVFPPAAWVLYVQPVPKVGQLSQNHSQHVINIKLILLWAPCSYGTVCDKRSQNAQGPLHIWHFSRWWCFKSRFSGLCYSKRIPAFQRSNDDFTLKMKASWTYETLVSYHNTTQSLSS